MQFDPKGQFNSPYVGMGNNPISGVDPDGGYFFGLFGSTSAQRQAARNMARLTGGEIKDITSKNISVYQTNAPYRDDALETYITHTWKYTFDKQGNYSADLYTGSRDYIFTGTGIGTADPVNVEFDVALAIATAGIGNVAKSGGTFYRAMSTAEYAAMESSGGLTYMAGKELFVSSSAAYSRSYLSKAGYDVLVQFNMKSGAMNYFNRVGVFHRTAAGSSGWAARGNLLWKSEQGVLNLGVQQNTHMFNPWIRSFKVIK